MGSVVGSVIGNAIAPGIGGQIGGAIGGSLGKKKAASGAQQAANREAELAYQRSLPVNVSGMFGDVSYDEEGRMLDISADPRLQAEADIAIQDPAKQRAFREQLEGDPFQAADKFYQMQRQLYAPQQQKDRLELEERLLAQGMLGSTGGAERQRALREAQAQQDLQAQYGAIDKAQSLIDTYRGRELEGIGTFETIGALPFKYGELSRGIGSNLGSAAQTAATMRNRAAQARAQTDYNIAGLATDAFKGLAPSSPSYTYSMVDGVGVEDPISQAPGMFSDAFSNAGNYISDTFSSAGNFFSGLFK
jgi:hypothetical protein